MLNTSSANCILDHVCNYNTYIIWIAPMCLTDYSQNVYMISNVYPQQVTAAQCFSHSSDKIIIITVISNWAWEESTARITPKRLLFIFCLFATTSASALWTTRRGLTLFIIHLKTATTPTKCVDGPRGRNCTQTYTRTPCGGADGWFISIHPIHRSTYHRFTPNHRQNARHSSNHHHHRLATAS